ncbi:MAG: NAD-glutamate dehydrogenase domain-containing protein [Planctomycetota bacterium]
MTTSSRLVDLFQDPEAAPEISSERERALLRRFVEFVEEAADDRYRLHLRDDQLVRQLTDWFESFRRRRRNGIRIRCFDVEWGSAPDRQESTVLEVDLRDHPFIVDTIALCLEFNRLHVLSSLHLALPVVRDRNGDLVEIRESVPPEGENGEGRAAVRQEAVVRFEISGRLAADFRASIEQSVRDRLEISDAVTRDFKRMRSALRAVGRNYKKVSASSPEGVSTRLADARDLVDWLLKDYFILMGMSFYPIAELRAEAPQAWGTHEDLGYTRIPEQDRQRGLENMRSMIPTTEATDGEWVLSYKSQEESLIHRSGKIDNFVLRSCDEAGVTTGFYLLRGLFTFKAIQAQGSQIPLVRRKLEDLLQAREVRRGSLTWKALSNAFDSIPVEFLFEAPSREVANIIDTILYVEKSKELRSHITVDRSNRKALYFLALPRHGYSEDLRRRIEQVLIEGLGATYSDSRVFFGKFETILLTFFFTAAESFHSFERTELDERVRAVAGTWEERLLRELGARFGQARGKLLWERYHRAFSEDYQLQHSAEEAVVDIEHLELFGAEDRNYALEILVSKLDRVERTARLRIYQRQNVYLSTTLPILDNFGLQVIDQSHFRIQPTGGRELYLDSFRVAGIDREDHSLIARKRVVLEALETVLEKRLANDLLHRLTVDIGLEWRDVDLFRAYLHYLRQLGEGSTFLFMGNTLREHPEITLAIMELFRTRFDPQRPLALEERQQAAAAIEADILAALHRVPSSAQDKLFRLLLNLVSSTLRTNRYRPADGREHAISVKINSQTLLLGTEPRPWREIYVYHHNMEGVHLRGGKLARGGIRWSDRLSDYRIEVLGLMRTQMVKNVLIVPVGAKGGFVVRRPDSSPEARRVQGEAMYRIFIHGLLDLTDNVTPQGVVPPEQVVRHDGDDPYLVVAADKGTAQFSDIANAISQQRGFWLGDAFASGGRYGYDHKALGITARGGWESVRRHFRELGIHPDRDEFSVVGIGDMSGDVFGNGMLLSRKIRLLAAFNHVHIFIDPTPDPEAAFHERERLFRLPRSTWEDYAANVLSPGGGVYSRQAKTIQLSSQAQQLFRFKDAQQTPDAVIRAILTLKVDLLWNGGIGAYVKASTEDNRDVGDFANESVRVDANQLRARVVGEGGNLGFTQAGRIEYSLNGGRMNTDFVDNSGGVDCSDHEVNLKILLDPLVARGELSFDERNAFLGGLSDEVCQAILDNTNHQGLLLSLDQLRSRRDPFSFERTVSVLVDRGVCDRDRDRLPSLELLASRHEQKVGLTRPELAYLAAYCKMEVYRALLKHRGDAILGQRDALLAYFPARVVERFGAALEGHLLGREIALTVITNRIVDQAGAPFFFDVERQTGAAVGKIVHAYRLAERLFDADRMRGGVESFAEVAAAEGEYRARLAIEDALHRAVVWLLGGAESDRLGRIEEQGERYCELLRAFERGLVGAMFKDEVVRFESVREKYEEFGFAGEMAHRLACFDYLAMGLGVCDIAHQTGRRVEEVTSLYVQIGRVTHIVPFVRVFEVRDFSGRWESLAVRIIRNSIIESLWSLAKFEVTRAVARGGTEWVKGTIEELQKDRKVTGLRKELRRLAEEELSIAALQVISERLRRFTR